MVNAVAHIDIFLPWLPEERFVAGGAAVAVAGRLFLGIRLRFHSRALQLTGLTLQQLNHQLGGNLLGGAGEETLRITDGSGCLCQAEGRLAKRMRGYKTNLK